MPVFVATLDPTGIQKGAQEASRALSGVGKSFDDMGNRGGIASKSVGMSLGGLAKTITGLAAALVSLRGAGSFIASGIDYNRQLQDAELGIATVLALNNKIVDAQGRMLNGQEKYNAAQRESVKIVKALDGATVEAAADFSDLLRSFQSSLGAAQARGMNWKENIDMVTLMSNAMKAMNVDMHRLDSEMLAFLTGKNLSHSQVRLNLGLDSETIKSWGTGRQFVENFTKALEQSRYAGIAAQKTYSVATAAVRENLQSLAAEMTKPLFDSLAESADKFANSIFEMDEVTRTWKVKENIQPLVDIGRDIAEAMGNGAAGGVNAVTSGLGALGGYINSEGGNITAFFSTLGAVIKSIELPAGMTWVKNGEYEDHFNMKSLADGKNLKPDAPSFWSTGTERLKNLLPAPYLNSITDTGKRFLELAADAQSAGEAVDDSVTLMNTATGNLGAGNKSGAGAVQDLAKAYREAVDATSSLRIANADLMRQLGSGAMSAFDLEKWKIEEQYQAQIRALNEKIAAASKTKGNESTVRELASQRELLEVQKDLNIEMAKRNALEEELSHTAEYYRLTGNAVGAYTAEIEALNLQLKTQVGYQAAITREKIRQATARRDGDVAGLLQTGFQRESLEAWENYMDFFEKDIPGSFGKAGDAYGAMVGDVMFGTKTLKEGWSDLGKGIQNICQQMVSDFTSALIRMIIFGQQNMGALGGGSGGGFGGLLGGLISGIGGMFSGGGGMSYAGASSGIGMNTSGMMWLGSAHGNAFGLGTGLGDYRNSVVASPTLFAFAKGGAIGLMGEKPGSPGEAIMPLERNSRGDLAVNVTGVGGQSSPKVEINIIDQRGKGGEIETQQTQLPGGGMRFDLIILDTVRKGIAGGAFDGAYRGRYGLKAHPGGR